MWFDMLAVRTLILGAISWSIVSIICFSLPYALAHLIAIKIALPQAKTAVTCAFASILSGILFILFSASISFIVIAFVILFIEGSIIPLSWGDPGGIKAKWDMIVEIIFYVPTITFHVPIMIILAVLNSLQARAFLRDWHDIAENKRKWDFWGMGTVVRLPGKRRWFSYRYATLVAALLLLVVILFNRQLGFGMIETGYIGMTGMVMTGALIFIYCLSVLIPYAFARPFSHLVKNKIVAQTIQRND